MLSSAVLTSPGDYNYRTVSVAHARNWLGEFHFESGVGYPETADAMRTLLGVRPEVQRKRFRMRVGDEALIFRLNVRPSDAHERFTSEWVLRHCEIGILTRTN